MREIRPGDIVSHAQMCLTEGLSLQRGMNFRVKGHNKTIILMSLRKGAPYADKTEDNGRTLIYEGHDVQKNYSNGKDPKKLSQPMNLPSGKLTENGKFYQAAHDYRKKKSAAELVTVYEKIRDGIWVYNGVFKLVDAWLEESGKRKVFKFKLEILSSLDSKEIDENKDIAHNRMIPSSVKLEVWKRDKGRCVECQSQTNLHFDHILPFSKGGTSLKVENIQLLCAKHNLQKRDKIK